jgi:polysaccharide pyruvyl transferase WcaK-like protein
MDTKRNHTQIKLQLVTNRDSDNVGDQLIEACDISLISLVMKNLGYESSDYITRSNSAGIVPKRYFTSGDYSALDEARKRIEDLDILIFGGAPMFNYAYQIFYKRTIATIEVAQEYNVPIIFSSIGVEKYSEQNTKCQSLKEALNLPVVKQITTRDDMDSLEKYKDKQDLSIAKVSDPALFTNTVFKKFINPKPKSNIIGLAVVRHNIFKDNDINFPLQAQVAFWKEIRDKLMTLGYECRFFTTGHFSDEAFLDILQRQLNLPLKECVFNMNYPEKLVHTISSYKAIIAYRLHANITAYSLGVPCVGLTWNQKVPLFYDSIGYSDRAFDVDEWKADVIVPAMETIISEGIEYNKEYAMTVYNTLFDSIKQTLKPNNDVKPFTYEELIANIMPFTGTSPKEKERKLRRKFRRTYDNYHQLEIKIEENTMGRRLGRFIKRKFKRH